MDYNLFFVILSAAGSFILGFVAYARRKRGWTNIFFFILSISLASWLVANHLSLNASDEASTLIWMRAVMAIAVVQAISFLFFVSSYPRANFPFPKKIAIPLFLLGVFTFILSFSPFLFKELVYEGGEASPVPGPAMALFVPTAVGAIVAGLVILFKKYRRSRGMVRVQIRYLLLAIGFMFFFIILFNFVFVVFLQNAFFVNLSPLYVLIFISFTTYAITKYRLMDIRLVIKGSVMYSVLVVLFGAIFVVAGYFIIGPIAENSDLSQEIIFSIAGIILVFLFQPVKRVLDKITDKIFFRDRIDYREVIARVIEVVSFEIDFDRLLNFLVEAFARELKLKKSSILLSNKVGGGYKLVASSDSEQDMYRLTRKSPLVTFMQSHRDIIIAEEIDREAFDLEEGEQKEKLEALLKELKDLGTELVSPVVIDGKLEAMLLFGEKLSGDIFARADLDFFEIISPQVGTAIIKAQLYKEQSEWNAKLKKEVADATRELQTINLELQQRNNFLISLQKITNLITRSLDFKNVFRVIVDGISSELQFAGGILYLKRGARSEIALEEVSHGPHYDDAMAMLPRSLPQVPENSRRKETLVARAIRTGHIQIAVEFDKFVSPQVSRSKAFKFQETLGFTSAIAVPIFSEDDIIGSIIFLVNKPKESIQEADIQMMKSLADQTGVVTRNLKLYEQLTEANEHLKEIDQVKSEFMSIASHQLRTPLSGIMGYLSMLVDGDYGGFKEDQKDILEQVLEASKRMVRLVNVFLNITRIEAGRFKLDRQKVQLNELIKSGIQELRSRAQEKHLKLTFDTPDEVRGIYVDPDKMADVVLNLVDNAIKYTEKGNVGVKLIQKEDALRCEVSDSGIGIDPNEAKRLFDKFVRGSGIARVQPDGSGLGLFIAKKIVEAHGGAIGVVSNGVGKGSTFWFEMPFVGNVAKDVPTTKETSSHRETASLYKPATEGTSKGSGNKKEADEPSQEKSDETKA